jgi:hypothetical protein
MAPAVPSKQEKKKGKEPAIDPEPLRLGYQYKAAGAPAGLPLFLQRSVSKAAAGCSCGGPDGDGQECEFCRIQREAAATSPSNAIPGAVRAVLRNPGSAMSDSTTRFMESRFGTGFQEVRIHTGPQAAEAAASIGARAFTAGRNIVFGTEEYRPSSSDGRQLLAHELTHVLQQSGGVQSFRDTISQPDDPAEQEARDISRPVLAGTERSDLEAGGRNEASAIRAPVRPRPALSSLLMRDPDPDSKGIDSKTFYENYRVNIWGDIFEPLSQVSFDTGSPYAHWLWGSNASFIRDTFMPIDDGGWAALVATAAPGDVDAAIRRGRNADEGGLAPDEYNPGVASELLGLYLSRVQESLNRLGPQFVAASYLTMKKRSPTGETLMKGMQQPVPDAGMLFPSHPLDKFAITGLTGGMPPSQMEVDYQQYEADGQAAKAETQLKKIRPIRFVWQANQGLWLSVRVIDPADATADEVAKELYGDVALASRIVAAGQLFGFSPSSLTPAHFQEWKAVVGDPATATSALNHLGSKGADDFRRIFLSGFVDLADPAAEILKSKSSDEAALNQAKGLPPTGDSKEKIIARMRVCLSLLSEISSDVATVGGAWYQGSLVRQKIEDRIQTLTTSTDDTAAMRWDAHSQAESVLLGAVANGVKTAADLYRGFNIPVNQGGRKDLPSYVRGPLLAVVDAYTSAAAVAELVDTANQRLAVAEEKSKLYPIDVMEGILAYCRDVLKTAKQGFGTGPDSLNQQALKQKEEKLRERLQGAREAILRDPLKVQELIAEIQNEVGDLQDEVTLIDSLDAIVQEWNFLLGHGSFVGEFSGKDQRYQEARDVLSDWYFRFYPIYLKYQSDRSDVRAEARQELKDLSKSAPKLQEALQTTQTLAKWEEEREHYITLGLKIAAVIGIGLLTAGIGTFVSEGLLIGAGWGLTTEGVIGAAILSSGAEAAAFTGLSTVILGRDPNQSLLATFIENWALFGALKGLSLGLEASLAEKYATFAVGRGGNITAGLAAQIGYSLAQADKEARAKGGKLSDEQATQVVTENLIVFIGTAIAARYGAKGFFEGAAVRGEETFRGSFFAVDQARLNALDAARSLSKMSTAAQARRALALDSEALEKEISTIKEMEEFAKSNPAKANLLHIDPAKLAEARTVSEAQIEARARTSLALDLKHQGGNLFTCPPGKLAEKIEGYRKLGDTVTEQTIDGEKGATVTTKDGKTMVIREQSPQEAMPADPDRFKLTNLYESLKSEEAQAEFSQILQESKDPKTALKMLEGMAKSKDGLEKTLLDRANARAARVPSEQKIATARQALADNGFLDSPLVKAAIAAGNKGELRGRVAEFLARRRNVAEFKPEEGHEVLGDIDIVQKFGDYKTVDEARAAHPGEDLPLYELNGQVWRRVTDLDVLVLEKDASGRSTVARMEEVKASPSATGEKARTQISSAVDVFAKIAAGDNSYRVHLNRKQDITGRIDVTTATADKAKVRGLEGKKGFDLSIGLTDSELNKVVDQLINPGATAPK